ncbi:nuclear transport factor 2 family protein [Novosphingobium sp.]|uniref:nuclear transport factor 2 family protein n=1 Tax=Novosphingobium sp. TaxID=1874826 RepID=UPI001DBF2AA0|nr:nuclear transport factor 2 family protein [Novosphingobium sp.]MBX9663449.1 nuclear transport factor 2 family protein [Novosphingobium sp.]
MRKMLLAAAMLGLTATPALANDNAMIQAADDALAAAFNKGDGAAVGAMYAPDATLLPGDNKLYKGADITAWWIGATKAITNLKLTVLETERLSPTYIREISRVQFDTLGANSVHADVTAVVVYKLVDGNWMLWTDIFH